MEFAGQFTYGNNRQGIINYIVNLSIYHIHLFTKYHQKKPQKEPQKKPQLTPFNPFYVFEIREMLSSEFEVCLSNSESDKF